MQKEQPREIEKEEGRKNDVNKYNHMLAERTVEEITRKDGGNNKLTEIPNMETKKEAELKRTHSYTGTT